MRGLIFDLDGTMVDNMMVHHRAWQSKLKELGLSLSLSEVKEKVHGINEEILERLFGDRFSLGERRKISAEKEEAYRRIFLDRLELIPGLDRFLKESRPPGLPLAIASAAPPENVNFVVDNLDIRRFFSAILSAADVEKGKPDPEIYLKTADQLSLDPKDCLVFEDSPTGAISASSAGCPLVIVTTTHEESDFNDIPGITRFIKNYDQYSISQLLKFNHR